MLFDTRSQPRAVLKDPRFWLVLLLAVVLRCWALPNRPISFDEGYSLLISPLAPTDIVYWTGRDAHPPLYYFLLHGWLNVAGHSVTAVRLLSVIPGVITVFVQAWLMDLLAGRRAAWLAGLLLAIAPFLVRYSQDVRMYSWLALWLWAATLVLVLWLRSPRRGWLLLAYAVLMTLGLYTHYFAGLTLASHWLYLLWLRVRRGRPEAGARVWWACTGLVVLGFAPWLPSLLQQLQHTGLYSGWMPPVTVRSVPELFWRFSVLGDGGAVPAALWLAWPLLLALLGIVLLFKERHALEPAALLLASVLVPIVLVLALAWKVTLFYPRYLIVPAGALPLLLALALDQAMTRHKGWATASLAALAGLSAVGIYTLVTQGDQDINRLREDDRVTFVTGFIGARARPGDLVLADHFGTYVKVFFYLPETVPVQVLSGSTPPGSLGAEGILYSNASQRLLPTLAEVPDTICRVWWLSFDHGASAQALFSAAGWQLADHLPAQTPEAWLYERAAPGCAVPGTARRPGPGQVRWAQVLGPLPISQTNGGSVPLMAQSPTIRAL